MIYQYKAANYCEACGRHIRSALAAWSDSGDSETYPQAFSGENETDSVEHCASEYECLDAIDLDIPAEKLVGAETSRVGAIITDSLTSDGIDNLVEFLCRTEMTPYQRALADVQEETFNEYLDGTDSKRAHIAAIVRSLRYDVPAPDHGGVLAGAIEQLESIIDDMEWS